VSVEVPPALAANVTTTWGAAGTAWLERLPATLAALARDWELELGAPFQPSYHWVCRARSAHGEPDDVGAWLYNPDPWLRDGALVGLVRPRLEQLADGLGQPLERVTAWGFVQAVLSAVWSAESGEAPDDRCLDVAALLLPRLS
jgi:hypothetical protein